MKLVCYLIVVEDIGVSRRFYEEVLGQKVLYDHGENIQFESGLSIHQKKHFAKLTGIAPAAVKQRPHNAELYFEEDDLEDFLLRKKPLDIEYIHGLKEQPWGQRALRFYDPDGHVVEIGETMRSVARRFLGQGLTAEETAKRISMPLSFVENCRE